MRGPWPAGATAPRGAVPTARLCARSPGRLGAAPKRAAVPFASRRLAQPVGGRQHDRLHMCDRALLAAATAVSSPADADADASSSGLSDLVWRTSGASPSARLACLRALAEIEALEDEYARASDRELEGTTARLRACLTAAPGAAAAGDLSAVLPRAFAAVRESTRRALNLWLHREQLLGGLLLLRGSAIEMPTGEGKTLVAVLAAYARSLLGRGSHVVTANAYLAARDRAWVGPVYERLGCSVGVVTEESLGDEGEGGGEELDERDAFEAEQGLGGWADGLEVSLGIDRERDEDEDEEGAGEGGEAGGEEEGERTAERTGEDDEEGGDDEAVDAERGDEGEERGGTPQRSKAVRPAGPPEAASRNDAPPPPPPHSGRPAESYPPGPEQARLALACDVTYLTASQLGFLWLGDATADRPSDLVLRRPLESAVVDEIDAVLLDDARQNLILSGRTAVEDEDEDASGWGPAGDAAEVAAEARRRRLQSRALRAPTVDPTASAAEAPSSAPLRRERLGVLAAASLQAACVLDEVLAAEDQGAAGILEGAFDALVFPRRRHAAMTPLGMQRAVWALLDAGHLAIVRRTGGDGGRGRVEGGGREEGGGGDPRGRDGGASAPDASAAREPTHYVLVSAENPTPPVVGVAPRLLPRRAALLPIPDPERGGSFALRSAPPVHLVRDDPDAPFSELLRARGLELVQAPGAELAAGATAAALWGHRLSLGRHVSRGLRALHCYQCDVDYLVRDGRVYIIDASTGRARPSTRWSAGLHEAVEAKHGLAIGRERGEVASINYATLFRLYPWLCGMTGTAYTQRDEFFKAYALDVARVPPHARRRRVDAPLEVFATAEDLGQRLARVADETLRAGRPLLVGTASVEASEQALLALRPALERHPGAHVNVLNARPERARREAQIVAQAGVPGTVTVATGMAGRGTDVTVGGNPKGLALALLEQIFGRKKGGRGGEDADEEGEEGVSPDPEESGELFDPLTDGGWNPWSDGLPPWEEIERRASGGGAARGGGPRAAATSPLACASATLPPVVAHAYASRAAMEACGLPPALLRAFDLAVDETRRSGVDARGLRAHEVAAALEAAGEARALLQRSGALDVGSEEEAAAEVAESWSFRTPLPPAALAAASRRIELALRWLETGKLPGVGEDGGGRVESGGVGPNGGAHVGEDDDRSETASSPRAERAQGVPRAGRSGPPSAPPAASSHVHARSPRLPPPPRRPRLAAYALAQWLLFDEQCRVMGAAARRAGGLRVVVSGLLPTRSELQLRGRAGRQGDPGDTFALASFDEPALASNLPSFVLSQLRLASEMGAGDALPSTCRRHALSAQRAIERALEEEREARQKADDVLGAHRGAAHRLRRALLLASPAAQDSRARALADRVARDAVRAAVRDWQRERKGGIGRSDAGGAEADEGGDGLPVSPVRAALRLVIARALQRAERASNGALRVDFAAKDFAAELLERERAGPGAGPRPRRSNARLCASVDADEARGRVRISFPPDLDLVDLEALTEGIASGFGDDSGVGRAAEGPRQPPELPMPESLAPFWNVVDYEESDGEEELGAGEGRSDEASKAAASPSSAYLAPPPHWMRRVGDRDSWERLALGSELQTLQDLGEVAVVETPGGPPRLRADEALIRERAEEQTRVDALVLLPPDDEPLAPTRPGALRRAAGALCGLLGARGAPDPPSERELEALAAWLRDALLAARARSAAASTAYLAAVIEVGQKIADRDDDARRGGGGNGGEAGDGGGTTGGPSEHGTDAGDDHAGPPSPDAGSAPLRPDTTDAGSAPLRPDTTDAGSAPLRPDTTNGRSKATAAGAKRGAVNREFADAMVASFAGSLEAMLEARGADALADGSLDQIDLEAGAGRPGLGGRAQRGFDARPSGNRSAARASSDPLTPVSLQAAQAAHDLASDLLRRSALAVVDRAWSSFLREFRVLEASANLRSFSHLAPEDELRLESEGAFDDLLAALRPALAKAAFVAELDATHLDVYMPIARGDVVVRAAKRAFG